ncbi:MAG: cytochrome b [Burkholderiales bacterium]|nr:MAG: cytochrome b [Burkholderiales bacterium]
MTSDPGRYNSVAIFLHWLLAIAIIGSLCVGLYMTNIPMSPTRLKFYNWHKWAGIIILLLSAARLLWRLLHMPPPLPNSTPSWQQWAARAGHSALYVFFFAVPLAGWAYSSAAGFPIVLFGVIPLPDWVPKDRELAEVLKPIHQYLAYALAATIIVHVAAALKHQFIDRDRILARMGLGS